MAAKRTGYDIGALKDAIRRADVTIASLRGAIAKEQATQVEYRRLIKELQEREAGPVVVVEIVRED